MYKNEYYTANIKLDEYIKDYRDTAKFIEFCKACRNYNNYYTCPCFDYDVDAVLNEYQDVCIYVCKVVLDEELIKNTKKEDIVKVSSDLLKDVRKEFDQYLLSIEKELNGLAFFAGVCHLCDECQKKYNKPCLHEDLRRTSLEAYGFDMIKTSEQLVGIKMIWGEHTLPPYFTMTAGVLFNKDE